MEFDMKRDAFFRGLLSALRLEGVEFIDTRDDAHHERFRRVVDLLEQYRETFPDLIPIFVPSPFTGRYRDFDDALLRLQRGLLGAQNPFYPGLTLDLSEDRARRILDDFSRDQRELFQRLASAYRSDEPSAAEARS